MCHLHTLFTATNNDEKMCIGVEKLAENKCSVASFAFELVSHVAAVSDFVADLPSHLSVFDSSDSKKYGGQVEECV